ncbi:YciI family protein [Segnochrobactrum spirostomi]|uniref:YciI family protein n=1 Tax=Segnochrobactrum spirostomi TaxID=2608987 RepID=A0A6A7Y2Q2_9HYPH|nr:YciI family protein [Segnochrobactrum spirostomi]MQT13374.1 YciI family protein [Segnochrobactrum spirostomi]
MLFVASCLDKADHLEVRLANRPDHLAWLDGHRDAVRLAGPFLDAAGEKPVGSMLIIEAASAAAVEALLAEDPYAKAGLFASVEIRPWRMTIGAIA